jgi:HK97 family phage major capsid protein
MHPIPFYLLALIVAIANTPLNIFDIHARNVGIGKSEPWRTKISTCLTAPARALASTAAFLRHIWGEHRQLLTASVLLLVLLLAPHTSHAHGIAMVGVAGLTQLETDLKAKADAAKTLLETTMRACADHVAKAATATEPEVKGRLMTKEEKAAIQAILDEAKTIKAKIDGAAGDANLMAEIERLTGVMHQAAADGNRAREARELRSLGQQFISDPAYRAFIKAGGHRGTSAWASPAVELHATTLSEAAGSAGPLILPDYQPGIVPLLFKRLVVADLIAPGTTQSNLISYMKETTFTNAAAAVAEGGLKPESALVFAAATSAVQKIAHWIPVTEEMLEDFEQTASIIDARLRLGLALVEEDQLLNGNGTPPNILGLMNLAGLTAAQARGTDTNADAIFKQMTTIATTVFVMPDGFVINPANWMTIQLAKNANGNYLGTGPWAPAQNAMLWGITGAVTPSIVANTALVGGFRSSAQIFRRGGVRVESSNSHASFFINNLVAVRGEERLALCSYRDAAFGKVTGLN